MIWTLTEDDNGVLGIKLQKRLQPRVRDFIKTYHLTFGVVSVFVVVFGCTANMLSFLYFHFINPGRDKTVTLLYKLINIIDFGVCFLIIPVMVANFSGGHPVIFDHNFSCSTWSWFWEIHARLSVFLLAVLSVARTVALTKPLHPVSRRQVLIPISVYTILLIVQESIPAIMTVQARYFEVFTTCGWNTSSLYTEFSHEKKVHFTISGTIPFLLPYITVLVSCSISIAKLCRTPQLQNSAESNSTEATTTIIILTVVYLTLNTSYNVMYIMEAISIYSNGTMSAWAPDTPFSYIVFITSFNLTYTIALNSTINPLIYIARIRNLRHFIMSRTGLRSEIRSRMSLSPASRRKSAPSLKTFERHRTVTPQLTHVRFICLYNNRVIYYMSNK